MIVNDELLHKLENLSALTIDESKKDELKSQLSEILNFVENLNMLEMPNEIPHYSEETILRDDVACDANIAQSVLKNAPNADGEFFIVPKIVE